jgi:hypothetical protein
MKYAIILMSILALGCASETDDPAPLPERGAVVMPPGGYIKMCMDNPEAFGCPKK